jgi:hypothetical protein
LYFFVDQFIEKEFYDVVPVEHYVFHKNLKDFGVFAG